MRLTGIRRGLAYYARAELADEPYAPRTLLGSGWREHPHAAALALDELVLEPAPRTLIHAVDLTIAAPKDVSVVWGLAAEPFAEAVAEAHRGAVADVVTWLERLDLARVVDGEAVPASGVRGVGAHHRLSRAGEPHLHTHVVLANAMEVGGQVAPLDHGRLRRVLPALELGYRVELAARLRRLGLVVDGDGLGRWEVHGLDRRVADAFSTRRSEVLAQAGSAASARARQVAALASRRGWAEGPVDLVNRRERWREAARRERRDGPGERGAVATTVEARRREEPIRIADPFFAEFSWQARAVLDDGQGLGGLVAASLRAAVGPARARGLLIGARIVVAGSELALDGSLARRYGSLPLADRLALAGIDPRSPIVEVSSRDAVRITDELRRATGREHVRVVARSDAEAALLQRLGAFRDGRHPARVVVDAVHRAPSELRALVTSPERNLLVEVRRRPVMPSRPSLSLQRDGRRIELCADLETALERCGASVVEVLGRGEDVWPVVVVPDVAHARQLRRVVARAFGVDPRSPVPGESALVSEIGRGRVVGVSRDRVTVDVGGARIDVAASEVVPLAIATEGTAPIALGPDLQRGVEVSVVVAPELERFVATCRALGIDPRQIEAAPPRELLTDPTARALWRQVRGLHRSLLGRLELGDRIREVDLPGLDRGRWR